MLHDQFVLVPADKAGNTVAFVCKAHDLNCILEELNMLFTWLSIGCLNPTKHMGIKYLEGEFTTLTF